MYRKTGFLSLLLVGGYYAWRNRFEIQRFLESKGVSIPLDTSNLANTVRSGVAKISGKTEHVANSIDESPRKAI